MKDFDAALAGKHAPQPFKLAGEVFTAKGKLPFKRFRQFLASLQAEGVDELAKTEEFLLMSVRPSDRPRLAKLLEADDDDEATDDLGIVGPDQVAQVAEWLMELYSGKPQSSLTSSSAGGSDTPPSPIPASLNSRVGT